ncbi:replication initiator protein [Dipodfec virus UOA04_Rod_535]|nr:replication initiator protein [Dipodfec virus UOA04_Rod_535]
MLNPEYRKRRNECSHVSIRGQIFANVRQGNSYLPHFIPRPYRLTPVESVVAGKTVTVVKRFDNVTEFDVDNCTIFGILPDGDIINCYSTFKCGKCLECLKSKQSDLRNRMVIEQCMRPEPPLFLTLTYNDEHLPPDGVSKDDVALFFNYLHTYCARYGFCNSWKHICFSEYGTLHARPHYHAIIFGFDFQAEQVIERLLSDKRTKSVLSHDLSAYRSHAVWLLNLFIARVWRKGFVYVKEVDARAFRYVSKYVGKDVTCGVPDGKNPNFYTSSRRFGSIGCFPLEDDEFKQMIFTPDYPKCCIKDREGNLYSFVVPKYVRDKLSARVSDYVPERKMRLLRDMSKDWHLLNQFERHFPSYFKHEAFFSYFHCMDIVSQAKEKFFFVNHYFEDGYWSNHDDYISKYLPRSVDDFGKVIDIDFLNFDVVGCCTRIEYYWDQLRDFFIDYGSLLNSVRLNEIDKSRLLKSVKSYIERQSQVSPGTRRSHLELINVKDYTSRVLDGQ